MQKKYHIIYADPPWRYNQRNSPGTKFGGGAMAHYDVMSIEDIKGMNVESIAEDNSVLFLWVTMPLLQEGLDVMRSWGFDYKTVAFNWVKTNKDGSPFFGIGAYTKSNSELCLLGARGDVGRKKLGVDPREKMHVQSNYVSQIVISPRMRHSAKPPVVRDMITELFGNVSRVELFARSTAEGWDAIGFEINGRDIREVLSDESIED
jgi:N6-adenosine-specific RNA methylase IME4